MIYKIRYWFNKRLKAKEIKTNTIEDAEIIANEYFFNWKDITSVVKKKGNK